MAQLVTWPTLNEANDETVLVTLTTNQPSAGTPLDLTGLTVEAVLKASAQTADNDPGAWTGTSGVEITIVDAAAGEISIAIPGSVMTTTKGWLRVDVLDGLGSRKTGPYGPVTVTDL